MGRAKVKIWLVAASVLVSFFLLNGGCAFIPTFNNKLESIVNPYRFNIIGWELRAIPLEIGGWILSRFKRPDDDVDTVNRYFQYVDRIKTLRTKTEAIRTGSSHGDLVALEADITDLLGKREVLDKKIERIISNQIREALANQDIYSPMDSLKLRISFPPLAFNLSEPPMLLVVSSRNKIESIREILLVQDIALDEMETLENEVDELDVSSLILNIGGLAAYPSIVTNDASLRFTLDTVTEEWLHQYLVFKPLGFLYLLDLTGMARNYEIATMNETLAGMVSEEIGDIVYRSYYKEKAVQPQEESELDFDFNREMREIRRVVDQYLAQGEIEQAEKFMEQKRRFLISKNYYIRKLNQAYFAFYGTYADEPTSISPIGVEMRELRQRSESLKDFLDTVAGMTSREELQQVLQGE